MYPKKNKFAETVKIHPFCSALNRQQLKPTKLAYNPHWLDGKLSSQLELSAN